MTVEPPMLHFQCPPRTASAPQPGRRPLVRPGEEARLPPARWRREIRVMRANVNLNFVIIFELGSERVSTSFAEMEKVRASVTISASSASRHANRAFT